MTLTEQVFAQAVLLAGELNERQRDLLSLLCIAATTSLNLRLRDGLTPDDCRADFVAAASLYALAAMNEADENMAVEEFKAGDLTVKSSANARDAASRCLYHQAELMITPYLKDRFAFTGV